MAPLIVLNTHSACTNLNNKMSLLHLIEEENELFPGDIHITHLASGEVIKLHRIILDVAACRIYKDQKLMDVIASSSLKIDSLKRLLGRVCYDDRPVQSQSYIVNLDQLILIDNLIFQVECYLLAARMIEICGNDVLGIFLYCRKNLLDGLEIMEKRKERKDKNVILSKTIVHLLTKTFSSDDYDRMFENENHLFLDLFNSEFLGYGVNDVDLNVSEIIPQTFSAMKVLLRIRSPAKSMQYSYGIAYAQKWSVTKSPYVPPQYDYYPPTILRVKPEYDTLYYSIWIEGKRKKRWSFVTFIGFLVKWPFFCKLVQSGSSENDKREIILPKVFPIPALEILLRHLGGYLDTSFEVYQTCPPSEYFMKHPTDGQLYGMNFLKENAIEYGLADIDGRVHHIFRSLLGIPTVTALPQSSHTATSSDSNE